jgi:hypothetical protein
MQSIQISPDSRREKRKFCAYVTPRFRSYSIGNAQAVLGQLEQEVDALGPILDVNRDTTTDMHLFSCFCVPSGLAISRGAQRLLEHQETNLSTSVSYFWVNGSRKRGFLNVKRPFPHASLLLSLLQTVAEQSGFMNIDMQDVLAFNPWLYKITIRYPVELIPIYDKVIKDLASRMDDQYEQFIQIRVRKASPGRCNYEQGNCTLPRHK